MLIESRRHTVRDVEAWRLKEREDALRCRSAQYASRVARAAKALADFWLADASGYVGTSWGKDSTVLAHLSAVSGRRVPLVWVRVEPMSNPDCLLVRDAFLAAHDVDYYEIRMDCRREAGDWVGTGRLTQGFAEAARRWGSRYVSGVRGAESAQRRARMMAFGESSTNTCAPLGWWSGGDVFAYLHEHRLPVHPAYACTRGGLLDRERIRVATLGGERGNGWGRAEWERTYYGAELAALDRGATA